MFKCVFFTIDIEYAHLFFIAYALKSRYAQLLLSRLLCELQSVQWMTTAPSTSLSTP